MLFAIEINLCSLVVNAPPMKKVFFAATILLLSIFLYFNFREVPVEVVLSKEIKSPAEKIFNFVSDPKNFLQIYPETKFEF
jgi:hypothetical protein